MEYTVQFLQIIIGSGLIVAIYNNYSELRLQNKLKLNEICENKFRSMLIFMDIVLHPKRIIHTSEIGNPLLKTINVDNSDEIQEFYIELIRANISNIYLYADEKLINAINTFLVNPSEDKYVIVAKLMYKRLWK